MDTGAAQTEVTVRIDPRSGAERFDAIVADLRAAGLCDIEPRPRFFIVSGRVGYQDLSPLSRIEGVAAVRASEVFKPL